MKEKKKEISWGFAELMNIVGASGDAEAGMFLRILFKRDNLVFGKMDDCVIHFGKLVKVVLSSRSKKAIDGLLFLLIDQKIPQLSQERLTPLSKLDSSISLVREQAGEELTRLLSDVAEDRVSSIDCLIEIGRIIEITTAEAYTRGDICSKEYL